MTKPSNALFAAAAACLLTAGASSQRLATYDPASVLEFAGSTCAPAPASMGVRNLFARAPSTLNSAGAIAADNVHRTLFTTTGWPADGIDAIPFSDIGAGAVPTNYAAPPGFNQVTAMCLDPLDPSGSTLIVSDGFVIAAYDYASTTFVAPPNAVPTPPGTMVTGLDYDVWTADLVVVCDDATILRVPISSGPWTVQPPAVAVPPRATGVALCRSTPGNPMVSFFNGTVMDPQTGAVQPFPAGGLFGVRRHRGMTFLARPVTLGGAGGALAPTIEIAGSYQAGSPDCRIDVESNGGPVLIAVDLAPQMTPIGGVPILDGTLLINPGTSISQLFAPGMRQLQLDLTNAPVGAGLVTQAATLGNGVFHMSDALYFCTWL